MSEKHSKLPSLFDLDELGLGNEEKEPDTSATINVIVQDSKTPGITKSLLALLGFMRRIDKKHDRRFDAMEKRDAKRMAWLAGALAVGAPLLGTLMLGIYELLIKPMFLKH